jgi:hypothetical protein
MKIKTFLGAFLILVGICIGTYASMAYYSSGFIQVYTMFKTGDSVAVSAGMLRMFIAPEVGFIAFSLFAGPGAWLIWKK